MLAGYDWLMAERYVMEEIANGREVYRSILDAQLHPVALTPRPSPLLTPRDSVPSQLLRLHQE